MYWRRRFAIAGLVISIVLLLMYQLTGQRILYKCLFCVNYPALLAWDSVLRFYFMEPQALPPSLRQILTFDVYCLSTSTLTWMFMGVLLDSLVAKMKPNEPSASRVD
ncbi:MAG: hypothetical protein C5B54_10710 [Acidobacteria bacterium]|nr:MAG: hypothetical protein C5B54_10710 [Acidobacteriota bacterium]